MKQKSNRTKIVLWTGLVGTVLIAIGIAFWIHRFRNYTPAAVLLDLRAATAARNAPRPVEKFLEGRYGPLTEASNRQQAFLGFFDVGHNEGLRVITGHIPEPRRQATITAMAQWIADYRRTMTPEEKAALNTHLSSPVGRTSIQQATAQYLRQDIRYRAATAPVITELMTTLTALQKP